MPQHRKQGHAKALLKYLQQLSNDFSLPLRIWISHADGGNLPIITRLAKRNNLTVSGSPVRWASLLVKKGGTQTSGDSVRKSPGIAFSPGKSLPG